MVDVNVMGSDISQGTDDYPAGPEDVLRSGEPRTIMSTWAWEVISFLYMSEQYDLRYDNGSEDGQLESLTGSTSAIMSKETRDPKTLSVADPLG